MERIKFESFGLRRPAFADEFIGRDTFEGLEASTKIIGVDEVGEMPTKLVGDRHSDIV